MSKIGKFGAHLKELRIHLCQKEAASQGVRDFIGQHYVSIKTDNPRFPILIRECSSVQPKLWARYESGKERCIPLSNLPAAEVLDKLESIVKNP